MAYRQKPSPQTKWHGFYCIHFSFWACRGWKSCSSHERFYHFNVTRIKQCLAKSYGTICEPWSEVEWREGAPTSTDTRICVGVQQLFSDHVTLRYNIVIFLLFFHRYVNLLLWRSSAVSKIHYNCSRLMPKQVFNTDHPVWRSMRKVNQTEWRHLFLKWVRICECGMCVRIRDTSLKMRNLLHKKKTKPNIYDSEKHVTFFVQLIHSQLNCCFMNIQNDSITINQCNRW